MISVHTSPLSILGGTDAGGLTVYTRELANQLSDRGVHVDIFTRRFDPNTPEVVSIGERVNVISINAGPVEVLDKNALFCYLPEFASEVALYSLRHGVRYDVIHSHYWLSGWVAHLLKRYWNAPAVHMYHTLAHLKNEVLNDGQRELPLRVRIERELLNVLDHVVAPNPDERAELVWGLGAHDSQICTIPPGIDLDRFYPSNAKRARAALDLPENPLVLYVGRIDRIKGVDMLLDSFKILRENFSSDLPPKLVLIGGTIKDKGLGPKPGCDLAPVVKRAQMMGIADDILFRGSQPQEALPDYYAASTVCVVPSLYESFGLVAVEAMACGLPVVATRVGGMKFTIEEGISGLLVPRQNAASMATALDRVIQDPDLRSTLQIGARQAAIRFSWHTVGAAVLNLYERLADGDRENLCCYGAIYAS